MSKNVSHGWKPAVALAALLVCGGALSACSDEAGGDPNDFIGTWTFQAGAGLTGNCTVVGTVPFDLSGESFVIAKGTSSDLIFTLDNCVVTFALSGTTATARPTPQSCSFTAPAPVGAVTVNFDSWVLQTSDGVTLTSSMAGSTTNPIACTATGSGTATKSASPDGGTD